MKIFKRLIIWILISLILQIPALYYLNSLYKSTGDIQVTQVDLNPNRNLKTEYKIPTGVENNTIKVSSDTGFMAYIQDKKLKVKDLESGEIKTVSGSDMLVEKVDINGKREYQPVYEWVPDREVLLVGYISNKNGVRSIKLITYSPITNTKSDAMDPIEGVMDGRYISAVQSSPLNNVEYFKVDGKNRRTKLYRVDIMKQRRNIETGVNIVGNIVELQQIDRDQKDRLYYESLKKSAEDIQDQFVTEYGDYYYEPYQDVTYDVYGNKSYITRYKRKRHSTTRVIKNSGSSDGGIYVVKSSKDYSEWNKFNGLSDKIVLLGIGMQDKVFLGKMDSTTNEVDRIYMSSIDGENLVPIALPYRSVNRKDVIIADKELFVNDIYGHELIGLTGRYKVDYNGKFIQIAHNRIITVVGNKMYIKKIKKIKN